MKKIRVGVVSLGCPKNLVDTRNILGALPKRYFTITADLSNADIMLLNTCTFIDDAKKEGLEVLNELISYKIGDKRKKLIVTGCMVQRYYGRLKRFYPEVDAFFKIKDEEKIVDYILKATKITNYVQTYKDIDLTPPHYSYVKIAEGCNEKCSFCIIPKVRGRFKSRPIAEIKDEVRDKIRRGIYEIILVAQDTLYYGRDIGTDIYTLLDELTSLRGNYRIRLLYLNINLITLEFVKYMLSNPKIINYFDIPLQHTSPRILDMMNRSRLSAPRLLEIKHFLEEQQQPYILRSAFIVGFPTETHKEFNQMLDFLRQVRFDNVGFFAYSHEEGTAAYAQYEDDISARAKKIRLKKAYSVQQEIMRDKLSDYVGQKVEVIVDGIDEAGYLITRQLLYDNGKDYLERPHFNAPEIDGTVQVEPKRKHFYGDVFPVRIKELQGVSLIGEEL